MIARKLAHDVVGGDRQHGRFVDWMRRTAKKSPAGFRGYLTVFETRFRPGKNGNGAHVHAHTFALVAHQEELLALERLVLLQRRKVRAESGKELPAANDARHFLKKKVSSAIDWYVSKGLSEVAGSLHKDRKKLGSASIFDADSDDELLLFCRWFAASRGRRQIRTGGVLRNVVPEDSGEERESVVFSMQPVFSIPAGTVAQAFWRSKEGAEARAHLVTAEPADPDFLRACYERFLAAEESL